MENTFCLGKNPAVMRFVLSVALARTVPTLSRLHIDGPDGEGRDVKSHFLWLRGIACCTCKYAAMLLFCCLALNVLLMYSGKDGKLLATISGLDGVLRASHS